MYQVFIVTKYIEVGNYRKQFVFRVFPVASWKMTSNVIVLVWEGFIGDTHSTVIHTPPCWVEGGEIHDQHLKGGWDHHYTEHGI